MLLFYEWPTSKSSVCSSSASCSSSSSRRVSSISSIMSSVVPTDRRNGCFSSVSASGLSSWFTVVQSDRKSLNWSDQRSGSFSDGRPLDTIKNNAWEREGGQKHVADEQDSVHSLSMVGIRHKVDLPLPFQSAQHPDSIYPPLHCTVGLWSLQAPSSMVCLQLNFSRVVILIAVHNVQNQLFWNLACELAGNAGIYYKYVPSLISPRMFSKILSLRISLWIRFKRCILHSALSVSLATRAIWSSRIRGLSDIEIISASDTSMHSITTQISSGVV